MTVEAPHSGHLRAGTWHESAVQSLVHRASAKMSLTTTRGLASPLACAFSMFRHVLTPGNRAAVEIPVAAGNRFACADRRAVLSTSPGPLPAWGSLSGGRPSPAPRAGSARPSPAQLLCPGAGAGVCQVTLTVQS